MTRALRSGVLHGLAVGSVLGLADGALALRAVDGFADRLGTMAVALGLHGAVFGALGAAIGLSVAIFRRRASRRAGSARGPVGIVCVAALAAFGLAASGRIDAPGPPDAHAPPNVILISVDTLRADYVGAYGHAHGRETTPNVDRLASTGVLFESAYSTASWTLPAHSTMLTGLDPVAHGAIRSRDRLPARIATLAQRLHAAGYRTEAWVGTDPYGYVGAAFGFSSGFEGFRHYPHPKRFRSSVIAQAIDGEILRRLGRDVGNATAEIDSVIRWLHVSRREPFFLFVHLYDVHSKQAILPYEAPPPFRDRFCPGRVDALEPCRDGQCASDLLFEMVERRERPFTDDELEIVRCLYAGAVAYVDHELGRLFDALDAEGLFERTVVIVVADHGEGFFEHGSPLHTTLYDEITRIPLVVSAPGNAAGKRASGTASLADIAPTVLALAGVDVPPELQGHDLSPVLYGWPARADGAVLGVSLTQTSYRTGDLKYIADDLQHGAGSRGRDELFDLRSDPHEQSNRIAFDQDAAERLADALDAQRDASLALRARLLGGAVPERVELGEAARARLRALGYADDPDEEHSR